MFFTSIFAPLKSDKKAAKSKQDCLNCKFLLSTHLNKWNRQLWSSCHGFLQCFPPYLGFTFHHPHFSLNYYFFYRVCFVEIANFWANECKVQRQENVFPVQVNQWETPVPAGQKGLGFLPGKFSGFMDGDTNEAVFFCQLFFRTAFMLQQLCCNFFMRRSCLLKK